MITDILIVQSNLWLYEEQFKLHKKKEKNHLLSGLLTKDPFTAVSESADVQRRHLFWIVILTGQNMLCVILLLSRVE